MKELDDSQFKIFKTMSILLDEIITYVALVDDLQKSKSRCEECNAEIREQENQEAMATGN